MPTDDAWQKLMAAIDLYVDCCGGSTEFTTPGEKLAGDMYRAQLELAVETFRADVLATDRGYDRVEMWLEGAQPGRAHIKLIYGLDFSATAAGPPPTHHTLEVGRYALLLGRYSHAYTLAAIEATKKGTP